eukprot:TRINITY_DN2023_c0_g1_i1.p1 TRINITY_DN2023_c0_g1~~TRINITY_DN2023_c0_g1_i1.p1  ORF type:complete len:406 (-),score=86.79 TRINITY_DN2023_c0_g1_i1:93-1280(-)
MSLKELLQTTFLHELHPLRPVVTLDRTNTLGEALQLFAHEHLHSVPVRDSEKNTYSEFVSAHQILSHALALIYPSEPAPPTEEVGLHKLLNELEALGKFKEIFAKKKLSEILTGSEPIIPVSEKATLWDSLAPLSTRLARVAAFNRNGQLTVVVSQSALLDFVARNIATLPFKIASVSLREAGLVKKSHKNKHKKEEHKKEEHKTPRKKDEHKKDEHKKDEHKTPRKEEEHKKETPRREEGHEDKKEDMPFLTIDEELPAMDAFWKMFVNGADSAAVVDSHGRLVSHLAESDISGITDQSFAHLLLPAREYIEKYGRRRGLNPPVMTRSKATIETVILKMYVCKVRRIWIVNENQEPKAIVTLSGILNYLFERLNESQQDIPKQISMPQSSDQKN